MATEIRIDVYCQGCGKKIERPSEADIDLWRQGLHLHATDECVEKLAARMKVIV